MAQKTQSEQRHRPGVANLQSTQDNLIDREIFLQNIFISVQTILYIKSVRRIEQAWNIPEYSRKFVAVVLTTSTL